MRYSLIFLLVFCRLFAQNDSLKMNNNEKMQSYALGSDTLIYQKPSLKNLYNNIPKNIVSVAQDAVSQSYATYGLLALGSTLALLPADPYLIEQSRAFGKKIGFNEAHSYGKIGFLKIIPQDINSALYFLGNGTTIILISGGLASYGLFANDYRALSTSVQLLESIAVSGVFTQTIKRITGRQSPFITSDEGRIHSSWKLLPSFSEYQKNTPHYDAMPSGHLTTAMAALTVLTENYPEKKWLKPIGYTLLGLLSFEMMQSKVHWTSDYPIALFLGYLIGKNIAHHRIIKKNPSHKKYTLKVFSSTSPELTPTIGVLFLF